MEVINEQIILNIMNNVLLLWAGGHPVGWFGREATRNLFVTLYLRQYDSIRGWVLTLDRGIDKGVVLCIV